MAMTYQNFASLGVNLNRQKYGPLDISNVFTSAADLQYYLTKGAFTEGVSEYWYKSADEKIVPYPYEGQVLATVIDGVVNVYTLALDAEGNFVTQEIAGKIEVDGTTIVKDADGKLSIVAPVNPDSTKTYNFAYANGVYSWVEVDTATAAGQAQAIAGLTDRTVALETTVNGKAAVGEEGSEGYEPAVEGLVDKVATNTQAIADETTARESAIENITKAETGAIAVAIANEVEARNTAIKAVDDKIGAVAEGSTIVEMISAVEDKIPTVPTNVSAFTNDAGYLTAHQDISGKADKADTYTKTEVDTAIDNAKKSILGEDVTQAYDTLKEIQDILEGTDGETIDGLIETVDANKQAIAILTGDVSTNGSVDKKIADAVAGKANTADVVATSDFNTFKNENTQAITDAKQAAIDDADSKLNAYKGEVTTALAGKADASKLNDYYTKSEADNLLDDKADASATTEALGNKIETAQITHTTTGVTEGVTKEGTALKIVVDAYTKAEVYTKSETDAEITKKITSINGGESAGEVKSELVDYRDALNAEIWGPAATSWTTKTEIDGKTVVTYTPKYGDSSRVDLLESAVGTDKVGETAATGLYAKVATAQAKADEAAAAVTNLENGQVKTNKEDIAAILTRVSNVETQASTNKTDISTLTGTVNGINTIVEGHTATLATVNADIIGLKAKDTEFTTILNGKPESSEGAGDAVEGLIAKVDKKANATDVYTKGDVDAKVITSGEVVRGTADSVSIADNKITVTVNSYTKGEVDNLLANLDQTELEDGINANADAIAVLNGVTAEDATGDTGKSVRAIALEEVAKVIDGAPEALDTLKEIADWIIDDSTGSAAVVEDIAKHDAILAGFGTAEGEVATVKKYVDDAIAAIPTTPIATAETAGIVKASEEVAVASDGKMTITKVSTDVLVQGELELILNGGSAQA